MTSVYCFDGIDEERVEEFIKCNNLLLDRINSEIYKIDNFPELIGGSGNNQIMLENHRNHISFMNIVLRLKDSVLLEKTLPWVYRTYTNQGFTLDYFVTELKLWKEAIKSIFSDSIAEPFVQIYDIMLENHNVNIEKAKDWDLEKTRNKLDPAQKEFLDALVEGNLRKIIRISEGYLKNHNMQAYYSKLITPSMYTLGAMWEDGEITAAHEHLASSIISRIMASYNINLELPEITKGSIVISAIANEYHEIGAWMTANAFELDGWNVYYLGANTPVNDIIEIIKDISPDILGISITMANNIENIISLFKRIRSNPEFNSMKLFAGGQIFINFPEISEIINADFFATSFEDSIQEANRYWSTLNAKK
jgi:methanogenic corrinoid protein MtbC1